MSKTDPKLNEDDGERTLDIPPAMKETLNTAFANYLNQKAKRQWIDRMPTTSKTAIFTSVSAMTHASDYLIKKIEDTEYFKRIYGLFEQSRSKGRILESLESEYQASLSRLIEELEQEKSKNKLLMLGNNAENYMKIAESDRKDKEDICSNIMDGALAREANKKLLKKNESIDEKIEFLRNRVWLPLVPEMLDIKASERDFLRDFAFLVCEPKYLVYFPVIEEKWEKFPLNWLYLDLPVSQTISLYEMFKEGEELTPFIVNRYRDEGLERIEKIIDSPYVNAPFLNILMERKSILQEVITCFRDRLFASVVTAALPLIEGILWEYSEYRHRRDLMIYQNLADGALVDAESGETLTEKTIGLLLRRTEFRNALLESEFIEYFAEELYAERNPVLHGRKLDFGTEENAAKKIATLEYLLKRIEGDVENWFSKQCEDALPTKITDEIIAKRLKEIESNRSVIPTDAEEHQAQLE